MALSEVVLAKSFYVIGMRVHTSTRMPNEVPVSQGQQQTRQMRPAVTPPSTGSTVPVIHDASVDARKSIADATSAG